ncbi:hypothetical protein J6590_014776 [Homalodisca vitripennis]|nr:hypothetical protein J6590_014776 [Homalodisca vitripennis]
MQCGRVYKHYPSLCKHLRYECGKLPQFACPYCPYKGKQRVTIRKHLMMKHQVSADQYFRDIRIVGGKTFPCLKCGKVYKHHPSLCKHQRYECGKLPQFACPHCPYKAKQRVSIRKHLVLKHASAPQDYFKDLP